MQVPTDTRRPERSETPGSTELRSPVSTPRKIDIIPVIVGIIHTSRHTDCPGQAFRTSWFYSRGILQTHRQKIEIFIIETLYQNIVSCDLILTNIIIQSGIQHMSFFKSNRITQIQTSIVRKFLTRNIAVASFPEYIGRRIIGKISMIGRVKKIPLRMFLFYAYSAP